MFNFYKKLLCTVLSYALLMTSTFAAQANFIGLDSSHITKNNSSQVSFDLSKKIIANMDNEKVVKKAKEMNINLEEEKLRIASLSDNEIAKAIKEGPKAGGEVVVISLSTLLIIIIVILLID